MRIRKVDASLDRQILTGMIVSTKYLKAVQAIYRPEFLLTPFAVTVAHWCLDYFDQYEEAPEKHIQDIFKSKEREGKLADAQADEIEQFLSNLSEEYKLADKFNVEYLLDLTERAFRARSIKCLAEDIEAHLSHGDLIEAEGALSHFKLPERMKVCGKPFTDMDAIQRAFESRKDPLFRLPGALGHLINQHLIPGGFVAFLGREKIGKTWLMMELKMWALKDKCNVAMFQLGDLDEDDYRIRQAIRITGKSNIKRYCDEGLLVPELDCHHNQAASCEKGGSRNNTSILDENGYIPDDDAMKEMITKGSYSPCKRCYRMSVSDFQGAVIKRAREAVTPLEWREAYRAVDQYEKLHKLGKFKLAVHPNNTVNVHAIEMQLDMWQDQDGFISNVVFLDYPDIMAPEDSRRDERTQENDRWKALRRLSQERHVLLIVVTQGNRAGYDAEIMQGKHVSEDKRKLSHVTAFFSLNQTPREKRMGILRVAPIAEGIREGSGDMHNQVCIIQCLAMGRPLVASYYHHKKGGKKDDQRNLRVQSRNCSPVVAVRWSLWICAWTFLSV